jgi:mannose-6-phosphate isomerase-like protein (cupin superfamily)
MMRAREFRGIAMQHLPALLLLPTLVACAPAAQWVASGEGPAPAVRDLDALLAANPLAPGENIKALALLRNAHTAHLLVQVRDREPVHHHADSDISVVLLRGRGVIHIGNGSAPVRAGDTLHIPRGVVHRFENTGAEPAAALVIYSPPPGPHDRVLAPAR